MFEFSTNKLNLVDHFMQIFGLIFIEKLFFFFFFPQYLPLGGHSSSHDCPVFFPFFLFFYLSERHKKFSSEPIRLKFGTWILEGTAQIPFFSFVDSTSESWVTVSQVEIRENRSKILLSGPIGLKIGRVLAELQQNNISRGFSSSITESARVLHFRNFRGNFRNEGEFPK